MLERTKRDRISFRIPSVLSKVEPKPDLHTGSGSATLILIHCLLRVVSMLQAESSPTEDKKSCVVC